MLSYCHHLEWRQCGWGWMNNVHWTLQGIFIFFYWTSVPFTHIRFRVLHILFQALMNAYLPKHGIWQTICKVGFYLKTPKYIFFLIPGFDNTNDITLCKCHILQDWGMKPVLNCFLCWWIIWRLSLRVQWTLFTLSQLKEQETCEHSLHFWHSLNIHCQPSSGKTRNV